MIDRFKSVIALCLVIIASFDESQCKLYPISPFPDELATAMFPNERMSLDDCHLRYYKHGKQGLVAPAFGEPAYLREFAHMAAIGWTKPDGTISWKCGGSLVWDNYVLTAAHCVTDNGSSPDVARFGDINIFSDEDDQFAQQLRIVQIIRHPDHRFSTTYNDIALLKLEANVTLHPTVSPACLWKDEDIRFPTLEATGWGDTGFAQERTPTLLKVTLKPINNSECHESYGTSLRRLREGIKNHQMCAGDERMDTCPGDSGGPLQVRLLHNGKMTPFLVGVTSFGSACGNANPGVYTRVSSFFTWIEETIRKEENFPISWNMNPITCALRFVHLREYEDDLIQSRSEDYLSIDGTKAHMTFNYGELNHVVTIGWKNRNVRRNNCSGTLIEDDVVLTLAECASNAGIAASYIELKDPSDRIDIAEIRVHPAYRANSLYNNIAVLKLKKRVKFNSNRTPVCIWYSHNIPSPQLQVAGIGRTDINKLNYGDMFDFVYDPMETYLLPRASVNTNQNCTIPREFLPRLSNGLANEHLCVGNPIFLVPNSCRLVYGAPMQLPMYRTDRFYTFAYGLNSFGRDCGFGEAAVSTRLHSHMDWLKTVLLPNFRTANSVQFVNPDLKEDDLCDYGDDTRGVCTHYERCPKIWDDFNAQRIVHFCSSSRIVCCPKRFILKERLTSDELDSCSAEYRNLHANYYDILQTSSAPHIVTLLGTAASNRCLGSLITKSIVVTAASCVALLNSPRQAAMADGSIAQIRQTTVHPNYDRMRAANDIALVQLQRPIVPTAEVIPACIWTNLTHTPLHLRLYRENTEDPPPQMVTMYNTDCQRDYTQKISADQLCVDQVVPLDPPNSCYHAGDQLVWPEPDNGEDDPSADATAASHVVGFYSYGEQCSSNNPGVFTRISSYVEWIRENI
ncbi:uncharacterized protein LOC5566813 isoform X1 [Aedes aegypti]|uniref:Peptidase S1 domain-containing protein n=2 Tax=Aedes aegypti TaxID=7159 RepID=A0A6I8TSW5_AEDAE|nr:uncharacterized protein LOC5566813 isoform X1 [Aedes aegypti]